MNSTVSAAASTLEPLFVALSYGLDTLTRAFYAVPGSAVVARYVKSSHQNDPGRTVLELVLFLFAVATLLQGRRRTDSSAKHFIKFSDKEIDELVEDWRPEPLMEPLQPEEEVELAKIPVISGPTGVRPTLVTGQQVVNLASFNFVGLVGNEHIKTRSVETLRKYGLGSCGPPGFYGTIDVHVDLERDISSFLGTESTIIYSQAFATGSSVIPAFCKKGDVIVADAGVGFGIRKGIQNSRSTVRYYRHNDMQHLEEVLHSMDRERRKKRAPLTRRFIITEAIFDHDGTIADLPRIVELKKKYKHRLILDETTSFGSLGKHGRGLTEHHGVPVTDVDILYGSLAHGLSAAGGFCSGSNVMVEHQRINSSSVVFSAAMPPLLAVCGSEGINILRNDASIIPRLQTNVRAARTVLEKTQGIEIPSDYQSPVIHICLRPRSGAATLAPPEQQSYFFAEKQPAATLHYAREERVLQQIVDDALRGGVLITRAHRLKGQENPEPRPSIRLAITAAMSVKETEDAVRVVREAIDRVLTAEAQA
ncbi:PLP-dependent transferase [Exidia glandulosa HHB12029]|uniref:serine C-palmitoyltransferase n=1 Tax=Exidia glandulosa HHB12029 TaxID=1314781 RepID=A0A165H2G6_EXIGL|nr:PLP-dependent transferase [Exidia glandulosa HHB12029]